MAPLFPFDHVLSRSTGAGSIVERSSPSPVDFRTKPEKYLLGAISTHEMPTGRYISIPLSIGRARSHCVILVIIPAPSFCHFDPNAFCRSSMFFFCLDKKVIHLVLVSSVLEPGANCPAVSSEPMRENGDASTYKLKWPCKQ